MNENTTETTNKGPVDGSTRSTRTHPHETSREVRGADSSAADRPANLPLSPDYMPPIEDVDTLLYWAAVYSIRLPDGYRILNCFYDIWVATPDNTLIELNLTDGLAAEQMQASVDEEIAAYLRANPAKKEN
jgi:hypothetical protein